MVKERAIQGVPARYQKARHRLMAGFRFLNGTVLYEPASGRGGRSAGGREGTGRAAIVVGAVVRNHDRNRGDDGGSARADDQRAGPDIKLGFVNAGGLARRQGHVSGESRRTNHRRYRNRGNNTFNTKHRLSPVI